MNNRSTNQEQEMETITDTQKLKSFLKENINCKVRILTKRKSICRQIVGIIFRVRKDYFFINSDGNFRSIRYNLVDKIKVLL